MDEYPSKIITTRDGGYIVVGFTSSNDGDVRNPPHTRPTGWAIRLNSVGNTLWERCLDLDDVSSFFDVLETNDSGFILAGTTKSQRPGARLFERGARRRFLRLAL